MNSFPIKPSHAIHVLDFTNQTSIGLHEYRERYPRVASIPTLTQLGAVGSLMERLRRKAVRREKRRAIRQQVLHALLQPFAGVWRMLGRTTPAQPCVSHR
jgi:hypothetical protein